MKITGKLSFRPATKADIPVLCRLLAELFTLEADFAPDPDKQARALAALIERQEQAADNPPGLLWLAVVESRVIGMCSLQVLYSTAEGGEVGLVEDVIVAAAYRRQGIGCAMLDGLEQWARRRGLRRLQLLADQQNTAAVSFYRKAGWQETRLQALQKHLLP
jgi:ribosomal protein S18 acetylase RimI-like enzyme